jgi:hypothetical protein
MKSKFIFYIFLFSVQFLFAQDSLKVEPDSAIQIRLSAFVDQTEAPLNRTVLLTVRLKWEGDLDRFDVHTFDNPIVQNFEIVGNASSNKVAAVNGVNTSVQDYEFTLRPTNLGMGYIEGIIVTYTDLTSDKDFRLTTNRIEVKVTDPIPEPGSKSWIWWIVGIVLVAGVAAYAFIILKQRKAEKKRRVELEAAAAIPMEEKYLSDLKSQVNLNDPTLDTNNAISKIIRLLRHFLNEKFSLSGLEATTGEVLTEMENKNFDERFINNIKQVLTNADMIKFSGGSANKTEVENMYTMVEASLQSSLRGELQKSEPEETEE